MKAHPWFSGFDFKKLDEKKLPAPYVPKIKSATDDSNFDHYDDEGKKNYPQVRYLLLLQNRYLQNAFVAAWPHPHWRGKTLRKTLILAVSHISLPFLTNASSPPLAAPTGEFRTRRF